jgi:hypothetical protein
MKVSLIYYLFISKINEIVERQNILIVNNCRGIKNFISFYFFLFNKSTWNLLLNYINKIKYNNLKLKIYNIRADVPLAWGLYFQDGASPSFEGIVDLHNRIMFYLVVILFGVSWVMLSIIWNFNKSRNKLVYRYLNHGIYVPIQKCSKFYNTFFKSKMYISCRSYITLSGNPLDKYDINQVKVYEYTYHMRKDILKENKSKSGIYYMLYNKLTNDIYIYIGQSVNIWKRLINYFYLSYIKSKSSFIISRALIKYGYSNFFVTILEYCDKSDLIIREQYYFNKLNPQYNRLKIAGSSRGFKHSEETKIKISKSLKGIYKK